MIVSLGDDVFVNAQHISLISGIQVANELPGKFRMKILLMGKHEHFVLGTKEELQAIHKRVRSAISQMGD